MLNFKVFSGGQIRGNMILVMILLLPRVDFWRPSHASHGIKIREYYELGSRTFKKRRKYD